eukprot:243923_1
MRSQQVLTCSRLYNTFMEEIKITIKSIVVDNGTTYMKAGFDDDTAPRVVFPTICDNLKETFIVGHEVHAKGEILQSRHPIEHGVITNWSDMEMIWRHLFDVELRVEPYNYSVLMSEPPLNPKVNREKMTQLIFETFNFAGGYIENSAVLSLYAAGRNTGIVCESGGSVTHIVPIYEGFSLPHAILKMDIGGDQLTEYLLRLLNERCDMISTNTKKREIAKDIKEKLCYVALDYDEEIQEIESKKYELPDGSIIQIGQEAVQVPEALFHPNLILEPSTHPQMIDIEFRKTLIDGYIKAYYAKSIHQDTFKLLCKYAAPIEYHQGIHELIYESWMKCDVDIRHELHTNIVLSGGSSMFTGITDRLRTSIPEYMRSYASGIRVINPPEGKYSAWLGGICQLAMLFSFDRWITRDEYNESGPSIVHRKC